MLGFRAEFGRCAKPPAYLQLDFGDVMGKPHAPRLEPGQLGSNVGLRGPYGAYLTWTLGNSSAINSQSQ